MPLRHIHMSFLKMIFSFLITKHMFVAESVGMHKRRKELTLETYSLEMYHYLFYFYPLPSHPRFAWCLQSHFYKVTVHFTVLLAFHKLVQLIPQKKKKKTYQGPITWLLQEKTNTWSFYLCFLRGSIGTWAVFMILLDFQRSCFLGKGHVCIRREKKADDINLKLCRLGASLAVSG